MCEFFLLFCVSSQRTNHFEHRTPRIHTWCGLVASNFENRAPRCAGPLFCAMRLLSSSKACFLLLFVLRLLCVFLFCLLVPLGLGPRSTSLLFRLLFFLLFPRVLLLVLRLQPAIPENFRPRKPCPSFSICRRRSRKTRSCLGGLRQ